MVNPVETSLLQRLILAALNRRELVYLFSHSLEAAELCLHILLRPVVGKLIKAVTHDRIGDRKLKSVDQHRPPLIGLAFPSIAPFEKSLKLPHDQPWLPLDHRDSQLGLEERNLDHKATAAAQRSTPLADWFTAKRRIQPSVHQLQVCQALLDSGCTGVDLNRLLENLQWHSGRNQERYSRSL